MKLSALPDKEVTAPASAAMSSNTSTSTLVHVDIDAEPAKTETTETKEEDSARPDSLDGKDTLDLKSPPASEAMSSCTSTTTLVPVGSSVTTNAIEAKKEDLALPGSSDGNDKLDPKSPAAPSAISSSADTTLAPTDSAGKTATNETTEINKEDSTDSSPAEDKNKFDSRSLRGWVNKPPFWRVYTSKDQLVSDDTPESIYWDDMTWKQKIAWRRQFVHEYFSETKRCLPYVRKLFLLVFRLSPWRTAVLLLANTLRGLIPALNLQTRGTFIMMVCRGCHELTGSCKKDWKRSR